MLEERVHDGLNVPLRGHSFRLFPLPIVLFLSLVGVLGCGSEERDRASGSHEESVGDGGSSPHVSLMGELPCERCEIDLELLAEVTDSGINGVYLGEQGMPRRDSRGRIHIPTGSWERLAVFDPSGELIRTLGRGGQGPGEFGRVGPHLFDRADSIWVWDQPQARVTLFSPDLEFVRTVRLPVAPTQFLPDGTILSLHEVRDPSLIGFPAHRFDRTGEVLVSFGRDPPRYRPDERLLHENVGGLSPEGLLWMSPKGRYELQLWEPLEGTLLETLHPEAPWFEGVLPGSDLRSDRPSSIVTGIWTDEAGVVWVLFRVAADDWEPCCDGEPPPRRPQMGTTELQTVFLDFVVQAVHPETGGVLAEQRFSSPLGNTPGAREVFTVHPDEQAESVAYRLWQPTLIPTTTER